MYIKLHQKSRGERMLSSAFLVEVTGFEPAASWSRTKRTTKLCHTSLFNFIFVRIGDGFGLAAARSPHGSNTPPACYSLPFGRSLRSLPATSRSEPSALPNCATPRYDLMSISHISFFVKSLINFEINFPHKAEMTLDHVSLHTIKGHFCSLLISNIFSYPLFH